MAASLTSVKLGLRTYARYVVPLTVCAVLVLAPLAVIALRLRAPANLPGAQHALRLAWVLAGTAWIFQLLLVAAAAPLARSLAAGAPVSQGRALVLAVAQLGRAFVPWLAAIATVALGGLALVVPGVVLLVLLSLTAASTERGMPAPLRDSIAAVRTQPWGVAAVIGAMIVLDLAIAFAAWQLVGARIVKKLPPAGFATYRDVVRVVVLGLVIVSPVFAALLAGVRARGDAQR